ncbi:MAG: chemotaxis protein CheR [Candidatus Scalindua sp. AMX11]|nr:MAG: chemotaxis protein CheR [Candidatus Scalindua sp.]NOG84333.1 chemotaxis protein CheR [Planctomycetota bacterium]RZV74414.1 MAG: chemotaxis protein CheR [Candidatus Scalindua sp. SCAELEC01]TDE65334.1 MAG: chemotaxis protein CheR [Candidatus Scalindua sp. AMX11]GJQ60757.1 MAG: chemotaxis protein CheR [Candidatus Scalindua sp.]
MAGKKKIEPKRSTKQKVSTLKKKTTSPINTTVKRESQGLGSSHTIEKCFPIVGIGASAGGLEALEGFISNMPAYSNLAMVVIQHLAPKYKSIMGDLLSKYTNMNIVEIQDGVEIAPNTVYMNPPDSDVAVMNGTLQLIKPLETHAVRLPIDYFFRSLSEDQGEKAICIVLSGTGTDGTLGLKAIKGAGGMTMVQSEEQAKYDSMPRSAINTGLVDFVLPVEKMPGALIKYIKHPYIETPDAVGTTEQTYQNTITKILLQIRNKTGHDFFSYKQNTTRRRIERRMAVHQIDKVSDYLEYLRENPLEVDSLYKDMLIGVTNFFRDPDAFEILKEKVLIGLLNSKRSNSNLRIWVPGCATGEEAYSIAILVAEIIDKMQRHYNVQIFGTDIDNDAIEFARGAIYPDSIAADVTVERLNRYFIKDEGSYKVKKKIREMLVFATQSLIKDPPFSRLDLVSCRNVMIYMNTTLQKRILPIFHYTLNADGYLFLGTSETIGEFTDLFSTVNSKWKIYQRRGTVIERVTGFPIIPIDDRITDQQKQDEKNGLKGINMYQLAEREVINTYAPPFVVINEKHDVLYVNGQVYKYLLTPVGVPSFNIIKMAHEDLRYKLSTLLHKMTKKREVITTSGLTIKYNGGFLTIDLTIRPLFIEDDKKGLMIVIFEEKTPQKKIVQERRPSSKMKKEDVKITVLQQELKSTKEYLQATIEELETSNEELKSTNEELQSTNEELETSKEEQQSTNEELETVNSELQNKVNELSRANNDLNNLLASTEVATIFLDTKLNVVRFTPSATSLFSFRSTDINRPISDINAKFDYDSLNYDTREVLRTLIPKEANINTQDQHCYNMRILPYRTVENIIDGVVITFVDITTQMKADERARSLGNFPSENPNPVLRIAQDGTVLFANDASFSFLESWKCKLNHKLPTRWKNIAKKVRTSNESKRMEERFGERIFMLEFVPVKEADYVNVYGHDISEYKRTGKKSN